MTEPLRIAHVVFGFRTGGLENGLVNLINGLPEEAYEHHVVTLSGHDPVFAGRIRNGNAVIHDLEKRPGQDPRAWLRFHRLLRRTGVKLVHTRNYATLDFQLPALLAGVRARVHGEHGWNRPQPRQMRGRELTARRLLRGCAGRYVALSAEIESFLAGEVGVPAARITRICNGVDTARFHPGAGPNRRSVLPAALRERFVIGTVGRMANVKAQPDLARAVAGLVREHPGLEERLGLVMVGEGPLKAEVEGLLSQAGLAGIAWLPGNREDVPGLMRAMDLFVLPSTAEGISNTILEAMASGLPVVATRVGGNPELVADGETGTLVPPSEPPAMAGAILAYLESEPLRRRHAAAARARAEREFSLDTMISRYHDLYQEIGRSAVGN